MRFHKLLYLLFFVFLACNGQPAYQPEHLRKLSAEELVGRARKRILSPPGVIYKNEKGERVSLDSLAAMPEFNDLTTDVYVNEANEEVERVIRKATPEDVELNIKIKEAFEEGEPFELLDIDCARIPVILKAVLEADEANRRDMNQHDLAIERDNQQKVVSILEKCGFPKLENEGAESVEAVFIVLQHAGRPLREKYFPLVLESAERGDLPGASVAIMEDRLLMDKGEKQRYGSQLTQASLTAPLQLYPIADPEHVNQRRAEVGLGPIEEYLEQFGIDYAPDSMEK